MYFVTNSHLNAITKPLTMNCFHVTTVLYAQCSNSQQVFKELSSKYTQESFGNLPLTDSISPLATLTLNSLFKAVRLILARQLYRLNDNYNQQ